VEYRILSTAALASMLFIAPMAAIAASDEAIEALRKEVADLKQRVEQLESDAELGFAINPARVVEPKPGGWKNADNWKLLHKGMERDQVENILDAPDKAKTVKYFEYWYYGDSKLAIYKGRLKSFERP